MAPLEVCNVYLDLQQSVPADMHYCYTDNKMWGQGLPDLKWDEKRMEYDFAKWEKVLSFT